MDKDEILEKSRKENSRYSDERDKDIRIKSFRWGYAVMGIVCIVFWLIEDNIAFFLVHIAGDAALSVYEAARRKTVKDYVYAIITVLIAIAVLCFYLSKKGAF